MITTLLDETIAEFGRSLGMTHLQLPEQGALVLHIANIGILAFELIGEHREDLSLSLTQHIEPPNETACLRILELCHYRSPSPFPVHAGFTTQGDLFFAMRLETADFTLPNMHQALDWLDSLHQQASAVVRLV